MSAASPSPRPRPILIYDGDCGFCTRSVEAVVRYLPADVEFVPWQEADVAALGVTREWTEREIVWVPAFVDPARERDVERSSGDESARQDALRTQGGWSAPDARTSPRRWSAVRSWVDRWSRLGRYGALRRRSWYGRRGGAQAAAAYLVYRGGPLAVLGWLARIPPMRWIAAAAYLLVAVNRHRLPGGTPACALPVEQRPGGAVRTRSAHRSR